MKSYVLSTLIVCCYLAFVVGWWLRVAACYAIALIAVSLILPFDKIINYGTEITMRNSKRPAYHWGGNYAWRRVFLLHSQKTVAWINGNKTLAATGLLISLIASTMAIVRVLPGPSSSISSPTPAQISDEQFRIAEGLMASGSGEESIPFYRRAYEGDRDNINKKYKLAGALKMYSINKTEDYREAGRYYRDLVNDVDAGSVEHGYILDELANTLLLLYKMGDSVDDYEIFDMHDYAVEIFIKHKAWIEAGRAALNRAISHTELGSARASETYDYLQGHIEAHGDEMKEVDEFTWASAILFIANGDLEWASDNWQSSPSVNVTQAAQKAFVGHVQSISVWLDQNDEYSVAYAMPGIMDAHRFTTLEWRRAYVEQESSRHVWLADSDEIYLRRKRHADQYKYPNEHALLLNNYALGMLPNVETIQRFQEQVFLVEPRVCDKVIGLLRNAISALAADDNFQHESIITGNLGLCYAIRRPGDISEREWQVENAKARLKSAIDGIQVIVSERKYKMTGKDPLVPVLEYYQGALEILNLIK